MNKYCENEIRRLHKQLSGLLEQKTLLEMEVLELRGQLEQQEVPSDEQISENAKLRDQIKTLEADYIDLRQKKDRIFNENCRLKESVKSWEEAYNRKNQPCNCQAKNKLREEITELRDSIQVFQTLVGRINKSNQ